MHIAIITAGGAGMFCGSCMHDNTWARALQSHGMEVSLIPAYTPIRVDEEDVSTRQVFFGGINVFLESRLPLWRHLPRGLTRVLDRPSILNLATKLGVSSDAAKLGAMTVAMLDGDQGPQRREVEELSGFLCHGLKPDVVFFSNALLCGTMPHLKREFSGRIYCILQGDDIFLEALREPYRTQALERIRQHAQHFDGFVVHSRYYRDFMADYLKLPLEKFHLLPLGIDLDGHTGMPEPRQNDAFTIGYFARLCPEKGLDRLIAGFEFLHERQPRTKLRVGGYLAKQNNAWFRRLKRKAAQFGNAFEYVGSPDDHFEKVEFIRSLDVLSVPTVYHEPKGLYVLEALANGVPVVQPAHGAFPEMLEATGGGMLVEPNNPEAWASAVEQLIINQDSWISLATAGHRSVRELFGPKRMAEETLAMLTLRQNPDKEKVKSLGH